MMAAPLLTSVVCLLFARWSLVRRAIPSRRQWIMKALRGLDRFFHRINQNRVTQSRVLIQDNEPLPIDAPIAWRETKKRAFGTLRYLIRMLILIEVPTAFFCVLFLLLTIFNLRNDANRSETMVFLRAQSPLLLFEAVENGDMGAWTGTISLIALIEYVSITLVLRELCLSGASRFLGRPETVKSWCKVRLALGANHCTEITLSRF